MAWYNPKTWGKKKPEPAPVTYTSPSGNVYQDVPNNSQGTGGYTKIISAPSPTAGYSSNPAAAQAQNKADINRSSGGGGQRSSGGGGQRSSGGGGQTTQSNPTPSATIGMSTASVTGKNGGLQAINNSASKLPSIQSKIQKQNKSYIPQQSRPSGNYISAGGTNIPKGKAVGDNWYNQPSSRIKSGTINLKESPFYTYGELQNTIDLSRTAKVESMKVGYYNKMKDFAANAQVNIDSGADYDTTVASVTAKQADVNLRLNAELGKVNYGYDVVNPNINPKDVWESAVTSLPPIAFGKALKIAQENPNYYGYATTSSKINPDYVGSMPKFAANTKEEALLIGTGYAGLIPASFSFKALDKEILSAQLENIGNKPFKFNELRVTEGDEGLSFLKATRSDRGLTQELTLQGKVFQEEGGKFFIPSSTGKVTTEGKFGWTLSKNKKGTNILSESTFELGAKGKSISLGEDMAISISKVTKIPMSEASFLFETGSRYGADGVDNAFLGMSKNVKFTGYSPKTDIGFGISQQVDKDLFKSAGGRYIGRSKELKLFTSGDVSAEMNIKSSLDSFGFTRTMSKDSFMSEMGGTFDLGGGSKGDFVKLYHGTTKNEAENILKSGFNPGTWGTTDISKATGYAGRKFVQSGGKSPAVVLETSVPKSMLSGKDFLGEVQITRPVYPSSISYAGKQEASLFQMPKQFGNSATQQNSFLASLSSSFRTEVPSFRVSSMELPQAARGVNSYSLMQNSPSLKFNENKFNKQMPLMNEFKIFAGPQLKENKMFGQPALKTDMFDTPMVINKVKLFNQPILKMNTRLEQPLTYKTPSMFANPFGGQGMGFGFDTPGFVVPPFGMPKFSLSDYERRGRGKKGKGVKSRYAPNIAAIGLNIRAMKIPKSYTSGFGSLALRPVIGNPFKVKKMKHGTRKKRR